MKKLIVLAALVCGLSANGYAQQKGFACGIWTQLGGAVIKGGSELKTVELVVAPGYAFNDYLFVLGRAELNVGMFDRNSVKTYGTNGTLGAEVGFNLLDESNNVLSTSLAAGNTLGNDNWNFWYADWGVKWSFPTTGIRAMLGLGIRYYGSETSRFKDYCNLYACVGFTFN